MSGRAYGGIHGVWHAPRGSDPAACDGWRELAAAGTPWSSGTDYVAGDTVDNISQRWEAIQPSGPTALDPFGNTVGAIQPGVASFWPAYWWCQASLFVSGANASPTVEIPNPVPMRYRLSVGPPNQIDMDGSISVYTEHQIEIQGDVTGLSTGDTVFILPLEYQHAYDVPYHTHDDVGLYVPCRLLATGEFLWNTP